MTNIHTLSDLPTTEEIEEEPPKYPKNEDYQISMLHFQKVSQYLNGATKETAKGFIPSDLLLPVPCEVKAKSTLKHCLDGGNGQMYSITYATNNKNKWTWDKFNAFGHNGGFNDFDSRLGVLIKGDVGVLDWDTKESFNWFMDNFITEDNKKDYNIYTSNDKHSGGHIWFKKSEEFETLTRKSNFIHQPSNTTDSWSVDYKTEWDTGTPALVLVPCGDGKKEWVNKCNELNTLPREFLSYMTKHPYYPEIERKVKPSRNLYMDIVKMLPQDYTWSTGQYKRVVYELAGQGCHFNTIYEWSKNIPQSMITYDIPHKIWLKNLFQSIKSQKADKGTRTIHKIVSENAGQKYKSYMEHYLQNGNTANFERGFVRMCDRFYSEDLTTKQRTIMKYYDKFFCFTTRMKKNFIYSFKYDRSGQVEDITSYQDNQTFLFANGVNCVLWEKGKPTSTAKNWLENTECSYAEAEYRPYGILEQEVDPEMFNLFAGYKMRYKKDYKCKDDRINEMGDYIDKHIKEVLCNSDEKCYNYFRAWIYKLVCLGERPRVAIVLFGQMGCGKGKFTDNFAKFVLGQGQYCKNQSFTKMMKDTFTDYYTEKSLMIVEEMPEYDHKHKGDWDTMKSLSEDDRISKRSFMCAPVQGDNYLSFFINTNHFYSVNPDWAFRRAFLLECNPKYVGDFEYMTDLNKATEDFSHWENWMHRHIIQKREEFKHCRVITLANEIPMTPYKQKVLRKRIDNFTYFFKYFTREVPWTHNEDGEDFHKPIRNKKIPLETIWLYYQSFVKNRNFSDWVKNRDAFALKLNEKMSAEYIDCFVMNEADLKECEDWKKTGKGKPPRKHNNKQQCIHFTDEFLDQINKQIASGMLGSDNTTYECITPSQFVDAPESQKAELQTELENKFGNDACADLDWIPEKKYHI